MASYRYRVVSSNGAGVHSDDYGTLKQAVRAGEELARSDSGRWFGPFEVERFEQLGNGARRYWVMSGKRWVLWDAELDQKKRRPFLLFEPRRPASEGGDK